ncbi:MAG TPA: Wzz/FepE/Etk N-terminal domain-containing protein [Ignavibacteriaceae bacterium]|nr:Wzz/FepE/Etk N-terminal domain-containing protein [Ignavibacteriaceae bacterium]
METNQTKENSNFYTVGHSLIEFLTTVVRYRWFLFLFVFIITASATIYALLSPKWYKASASVLPAEKTDFLGSLGGLSSLVKGFSPSKGLAALTGTTELDRYMAILKSGTMIDDVIKKFNLRKEYEREDDYYEKVVKEFLSNLEIEPQDEGNLLVSVYDKDPQKAADMANYMVEKLNEINTRLSVTNAKANREFIEKRFIQNENDINQLETDMKDFQEKYGVIAVPEQLEATIIAMSEINAELAQKEVALNVIRRTYGENSPMLNQAEIEVEELQKKINILNAGTDISKDGINLIIPFKKAPDMANKYLKIFKDLEIQYKILEFVQPMYEQAKVEEVRNTPSVLILDKAGAPELKARPRGSIYFLISFLSSTFIGIIIIFSIEGANKMKQIAPDKYEYIRRSLRFKRKKAEV